MKFIIQKSCLKNIEKNLYRNNNYKRLKNLIALNNKHLYDMRLLLLGCTGFVGKELVPTLLNENHEIYIVSRKPISKLKVDCLLYTSPSPRDREKSRMPSSA